MIKAEWERWSADVAESHTTYLPLVNFRSPRALSSWVTAQLAVLDAATLYLSLLPDAPSAVSARLCLRGGFTCLTAVTRARGFAIPDEADPNGGIALTFEEFVDAIDRLARVDFPLERSSEEAWLDFVGWRVNYEAAAYAIAHALSTLRRRCGRGPRRHPIPVIPPLRPAALRAAHRPPRVPQNRRNELLFAHDIRVLATDGTDEFFTDGESSTVHLLRVNSLTDTATTTQQGGLHAGNGKRRVER